MGTDVGWVSQGMTQVPSDLIVTSVDASAVVTDCQTRQLGGSATVTVENQGGLPRVYRSRCSCLRTATATDGSTPVRTRCWGAPYSPPWHPVGPTWSAFPSGVAQFKGNLTYAFADSGNSVPESNETNSVSNSGLSCEFLPTPGSFNPVPEWSWTSSAVLPAYLNVMMTPTVIDLNGNSTPDVVFGSTD